MDSRGARMYVIRDRKVHMTKHNPRKFVRRNSFGSVFCSKIDDLQDVPSDTTIHVYRWNGDKIYYEVIVHVEYDIPKLAEVLDAVSYITK